ncbi:hypothetical protein [Streptomyces jumonjinensis]|uniref:DUF3558 domain-containing protein n=1 Tax=Streptomyces jumonjinensis TaxID=1945 RepID=A0A646KQF9_STRJU|nr:hypothetical protein [Streptomyces jumonjinensis]MQT04473.1 hypothetical protein [Streptomyces jumonjinensis]
MISEPELMGDDGEPPRGEDPPGRWSRGEGDPADPAADTVSAGPGPVRAPIRAWLWALGGALTASALWAGGLYAYEPGDPDLGGYRASRDLCADAGLKALTAEYGPVSMSTPTGRERPSLDHAACWFEFRGAPPENGAEPVAGSGSLSYVRHKKTDPGPQFEATVAMENHTGADDPEMVRVDGLGERAYFVWAQGYDVPVLHVLDGQSVLSMSAEPPRSPSGEIDRAEAAGVRNLMVADMKALMRKLQS